MAKQSISTAAMIPLAILGAFLGWAALLVIIYFLEQVGGPITPVLFAISLFLLRFDFVRRWTIEHKWRGWADAARSVGLRLEGKDVAALVESNRKREWRPR